MPTRIAKLKRCNGVAVDLAAKLVLVKLYSNVRRWRGELNSAQHLAEDLGTWPRSVRRALDRLEDALLIYRRLRFHASNAKKHPGGYDVSEIVLIDGALIADDARLNVLTADAIASREAWHRDCEAAGSTRASKLKRRDEV